MKRSTQQRRLKWNLRQMSSAFAVNLAFTSRGGGGQHCIVAHPGESNLQQVVLVGTDCKYNFRAQSILVTVPPPCDHTNVNFRCKDLRTVLI